MKSLRLDSEFWTGFAKSHWERKALVARQVQTPLVQLDHDQVFQMLVRYSDRCRKRKDPTGFKLFIDGLRAYDEDVLQVLPQKKDQSLLGYHARMANLFQDYCLVCDELLQVSDRSLEVLSEFTDALYSAVGFPNRFAEMGLYLGNYRRTPFGVHVDRCGVFSFPVVGQKQFRLWAPAFAEKHPALDRSMNYSRFKKDSKLLRAGPGDMVYWPSNAWHIAESKGEFSATWSLGVWVDRSFTDIAGESVAGLIERMLPVASKEVTTSFQALTRADGEVVQLPANFQNLIEIFQTLPAQDLEFEFLKTWSSLISKRGFKTLPQLESVGEGTTPNTPRITANSKIQLRSKTAPLLWFQHPINAKGIVLAFGGVLYEAGHLKRLCQALARGETIRVGDYIKDRQTNKKTELKTLSQLLAVGALTTLQPTSSSAKVRSADSGPKAVSPKGRQSSLRKSRRPKL